MSFKIWGLKYLFYRKVPFHFFFYTWIKSGYMYISMAYKKIISLSKLLYSSHPPLSFTILSSFSHMVRFKIFSLISGLEIHSSRFLSILLYALLLKYLIYYTVLLFKLYILYISVNNLYNKTNLFKSFSFNWNRAINHYSVEVIFL